MERVDAENQLAIDRENVREQHDNNGNNNNGGGAIR